MKSVAWIDKLAREASGLHDLSQQLGLHQVCAQIALRLDEAKHHMGTPQHESVRVALWGGTGSGKSTLFNALCGLPLDQGASSGSRGYTKVPRIAASPADRPLVAGWGELVHSLIDGSPTLIDCPDIDSAVGANREAAELVINHADVVVMVTTDDKRANFDISREIRRWAARKRWFFVMNKVDRIPEDDVETAREDFCKRVREMSFRADPETVFLISATGQSHGYDRLKNTLFNERSARRVHALREEQMVRRLRYAFEDELLDPYQNAEKSLREDLDPLKEKTQACYRQCIKERGSVVLANLQRERIWQRIAGRVGGSMSLMVHARARLGLVLAAGSSGFLLSRGRGVAATLRMLWGSLASVFSMRYTLRQILAGHRDELERELKSIAQESLRIVEESGVELIPEPESQKSVTDASADPDVRQMEIKYRAVLRLLGFNATTTTQATPSGELDLVLHEALEESSGKAVDKFPRYYAVICNLLPLVLLADFIYRIVTAWVGSSYQDFAFFINFVVIFMLAHVPGCLLVSLWVRRHAQSVEGIIDDLAGYFPVPGPAERVIEELSHFLRQVMTFRKKLDGWLRAVEKELTPQEYGAVLTQESYNAPESTP